MREGLHRIVSSDETIVAIATPFGRSGIGVIRISGSAALSITNKFFKTHSSDSPVEHRRASIGTWTTASSESLDEVVVTFFKAPHSYTGEDVVEVSAHGNPLTL